MSYLIKTISRYLTDKSIEHILVGSSISLDPHNTIEIIFVEDADISLLEVTCRRGVSSNQRINVSVADPELLDKVYQWARHKQLHLAARKMIKKIPIIVK